MERLEIATSQWSRVSPKLVTVELIGGSIFTLLASTAAVVLWLMQLPWLAIWPTALAVVGVIGLALTPRRVRAIGYQLRDDDLLFRRGIGWQRFVAVPYGRMQLVDINRGPVARLLGLSELKFVTAAAATSVTIPGLPEAVAEQLRDSLVALAESRRAGL